MNTTQIKRLVQQNQEFVPITLSEAVVVNTTNIVGLSSLGITTLDKVLRTTLGVVGVNSASISQLQTTVKQINTELEKKQDKLTPGAGITITDDGVISVTSSIELYKIVQSLPSPSQEYTNVIYLVPSTQGASGNIFKEYICVYQSSISKYVWEQLGEVQTDVDLSGYVTTETFQSTIASINSKLDSTITAQNVTTSGGTNVIVNYTIPRDLYDSMVSTDSSDQIIGG